MIRIFILLFLLLPAALKAQEQLIWQLGEVDGKNTEFLKYTSKELLASGLTEDMNGYSKSNHTFAFMVRDQGTSKPYLPGGISSPGAANQNWVNKIQLFWNDNGTGYRKLKLRILPSDILVFTPGKLNENLDRIKQLNIFIYPMS